MVLVPVAAIVLPHRFAHRCQTRCGGACITSLCGDGVDEGSKVRSRCAVVSCCGMACRSVAEGGTANEDTSDRLPAGVGRGPGATAGEGEGAHPGARCVGGRTPAHAVDGRGEGLPLRRAERPGKPARPLRGPSPADRLPRLLRAGHHHLRRGRLVPGACLRGLLVRRRPGRAPGASECPRHHAGVRVAGPAGGHRAPEGAEWVGS